MSINRSDLLQMSSVAPAIKKKRFHRLIKREFPAQASMLFVVHRGKGRGASTPLSYL
jgi:hypothetical protein